MNDSISRRAAIEAIFSEPLYESGMKKRDADAVVPAIYEKIKSLPSAQPEPRWIPCNWHDDSTLPKECESVLICIEDNSGKYIDVSYRTDYNRWERCGRGINVTAWMPLPEPYEMERSDE